MPFQMQDNPYFELKYPVILGTDVAGTVVQLGSNVTRFKIGQRVIGYDFRGRQTVDITLLIFVVTATL
jgi:NADPH:quinone reductase-like Zn-dependent oxidoreductase